MAARKLRFGPSGPLDGESIPPGTVDGQVPTWDNTTKEYTPQASGEAGVASVFGRAGVVVAENGDYTSAQVSDASTVGGPTVEDSLSGLQTSVNGLEAQLEFIAPHTALVTVATPALVAGVLGYFDVDLSATVLAPVAVNTPLIATPQVDMVPAGATNGFYIGLRVSALNTARLTFVGTIPGGDVPFLFTKLAAS